MSEDFWMALMAQVVVVVLAFLRVYSEVRKVHKLVNGHSTAQTKLIERQGEQIARLSDSLQKKG